MPGLSLSALKTAFGSYYDGNPNNAARLIRELTLKKNSLATFNAKLIDETSYKGSSMRLSGILQRMQKIWTPKGTITISPREIAMQHLKVNLPLDPDDLEASHVEFLSGSDGERKNWPIVRYLMEAKADQGYDGVLARIHEDRELNEIYWGVPGSITSGTATADGTNLLGINKNIKNMIASGAIPSGNIIATGAITDSDAGNQLQSMIDGMPEKLQEIPITQHMSRTVHNRYRKWLRDVCGKDQDFINLNQYSLLDRENVKIEILPAMHGAEMVWMTYDWNKMWIRKRKTSDYRIKMEESDYSVKIFMDWEEGLGLNVAEYTFVNDQVD